MQSFPGLLYVLIREHAEKMPHAPAILAPDKPPVPYQQLASHIQTTALRLNQLGLRRGDRVAVVLPNGPEMASAYLAVSAVCTCAPLNPAYSADEFKFYLTDLRAKALILPSGNASPARGVAAQLNVPILELDADAGQPGLFTLISGFAADPSVTEPEFALLEDVALVLHTSGTTSRPKIVPLTHRNISYSIRNIAQTYDLGPSDRVLNMMPLFHIHGLMASLSATLSSGGSIICAPGMRQEQVLDWLLDLAPTWYSAVPTIHQAVLEQATRNPQKASQAKLRFIRSSSSSLPPVVAEGLERAFGAPVLEAYGMTEATHQMSGNPLPPRPHKFGSVGLPTGVTRVRIVDECGNTLPVNTVGEIAIFGDNVTAGYENNPHANLSSFVDGWLRTGDLGKLDEDGYLFIQGRLKEQINRGGEKISPRQVDVALLCHPAVKQVAVFAVPHPSLGEDIAAAVVLQPGQTVTMQELRQFAAARMADFKVPRQIVFLKEIPKNSVGKIQRIGMAERLKAELDALRFQESDGDAPLTPLQVSIQSIWQKVLGQQKIGIQEDFLALGGESLQAARILMQINEKFGTDLQIGNIFDAPTVATMAEVVQTQLDARE